MLVVPGDLARFSADRQRRVVVQVLVARPAEHELGRRRRHRRAHVDQVERRIVARDHPGPDVHPLLVRHVAPCLVAGLSGRRNQTRAPQMLPRGRIVRGDHAGYGSGQRAAAPAGDELAVGDERPGGLPGGMHRVVEDLRFPRGAARRCVEGVDVVVGARVEYVVAVQRQAAVGRLQPPYPLRDVVRDILAVLPQEVAGSRVDGLGQVAGIGQVHHAVVHQGRGLLAAGSHRPRPYQAQLADVVAVDLLQRAVAPAVERAAPHDPVIRIGVQDHGVRDRDVLAPGLRLQRVPLGRQQQTE